MLEQLKNFNVNAASIEEMVALRAYGSLVRDEFDAQMVEVPEWLEIQLKNLARQIKAKNADRLAARRKEVQARLENLKTPTEKKTELRKELQSLDKQLAEV
jgi:DNA repair ATPase RecN